MSQCFCLNPTIIRNYVGNVDVNGNDWMFFLRGSVVTYVPSPKTARIKSDELDSCYYLNNRTGEIVPMYMEVPCGKCLLCGDKKAKDWSCRIMAEYQYHSTLPWWITLTYNDFALPSDRSLDKKALSNFLKRLRERVSRVVGSDIRLRFCATGEYGGSTARPHYHLVLFGMPKLCVTKMLLLLENAWSKRVSKKVYLTLPSKFRFYRLDKNGKKLYYQRIGFVYVKPAHDNTPLYLAKYMFKPELNTPDGCTPNFNLSSRKNGIGYDYILDKRDWHRCNPDVTQISLVNKWSGKLFTFGFPRYFADYIFPTISRVLPVDVKKAIDSWRDNYANINALKTEISDFCSFISDDLDELASNITNKYSFLLPVEKRYSNTYMSYIEDFFTSNCVDKKVIGYKRYFLCWLPPMDGEDIPIKYFWHEPLYEYTPKDDYNFWLTCLYRKLYSRLLADYNYIMSCSFDTSEFVDTIRLRDFFKTSRSRFLDSQPKIDPEVAAETILRKWRRMKVKDKN